MKILTDISRISQIEPEHGPGGKRGTFLTIGAFDGLHLGHQHLVRTLREAAARDGGISAVLTFHPSPKAVLRPNRPFFHLISPEEKSAILAEMGLDLLLLLPFGRRMAGMPYADFMRELAAGTNLKKLWVGPDFAMGRGREGNVESLAGLGREMGFEVGIVPFYRVGGHVVSSTRIRCLLRDGDVREAAGLLGRHYNLPGVVVQGEGRGREMGFPTANLSLPEGRVIPADGIYATYALVDGVRRESVTNVGVRPSFGGGPRTVEPHLLDFSGNLYGKTLSLEFVERLRPEMRFDRVEDLVQQMRADAAAARAVFAGERAPQPS